MDSAYINAITTAVPDFDVHDKFIQYCPRLLPDQKSRRLFSRMAKRTGVDHRYSFLQAHRDDDKLDTQGFYNTERFPSTRQRMALYEQCAPRLAWKALDSLDLGGTTHLVTTTCTGFYAPGIDHQIIERYGLSPGLERTSVGFMGCYAAINGLKLARHIVRSSPQAKVLMLNLELCTLHLQDQGSLEEMLSFLIFSDGCAASLISAQTEGLKIDGFKSDCLADSSELITWRISDTGFDMSLSGQVPGTIARHLPDKLHTLLDGYTRQDIKHWAIHPGGRTVLDATRDGAELDEAQLAHSREVLRRYGNMSSASIMFVLQSILNQNPDPGPGLAMAFGPGLNIESMRFSLP